MLDFSFTPEQEALRGMVREFAKKELAPQYSHWDKNEEFPKEQLLKMGKLGIVGVDLPEKYGGKGADCVTAGIVLEEVARGDFSCGYPVTLAELVGGIITVNGTEEQKQHWLPPLIRGETTMTLAITEPHAGSDAGAIATTAVREGDYYIINGRKAAIDICLSDAVVIWAKTNPEAGTRGISAFIVPGDTLGLVRTPLRTMGCKGARLGNIEINNVRVPASNLLGEENRGFHMVMRAFDYSRALMGLWCLGAAQAALDDAIFYAKFRTAFGKPIGKFEGISFPLAENSTLVEAARMLCYKALWLRDHNLPHTKEAAMCKWWAPKLAADVIHHCMLVHGWYGYTDHVPQEQRLRDVIGLETGDGTGEVMKMIIVREILGREYLPY